ncbi:MAG: hypothetical protein AUH79_07835 [Betaproteobacteria bacterium 13_1_40CM_4_64_4]|nr:MAG: hypothetical protein AUH79_07835 [Betaproteobacteria bacterium 13_1_40CM_4_64_4]
MTRPRRPFFVLILSLLLVGMQAGAQLHALEHDGERLARPHGAALLIPGVDEACAVCASFAGGSHAIPTSVLTIGVQPPCAARSTSAFASIAGTPPAYYQTRAPPALL